MNIRTLIVDDEALARRRIRSLLARESDVEILEECPDGPAAIDAIGRHRPDLIFLDVEMPSMNGFDALLASGSTSVPAVVFVTAHEEFSLKAFDVHAIDYLLKPFHRTRFQETLRRVRGRLGDARELTAARARLTGLAEPAADEMAPRAKPIARIAIKSTGKVTIVRTSQIDWIEGDGNYARLHVGRSVHLLRQTLKSLAEQLDANVFVRIHHSRIVNVERVRELRPWSHGDYLVVLEDGSRLTSSRSYSANLRRSFFDL